ncbi:hypothetical protein ACFWVC_16040 [Streptomyces sp. NPDC058691]|uniref:hypothetical protein n=1 Tax=Streptomyces sp. NPDC058691 TaxID=3346601 RepID=UPI0036549774
MNTTRGRDTTRGRSVRRTVFGLLTLGALVLAAMAWPTVSAQVRAANWPEEAPKGPDHITARMTAVRDAVIKEFGPRGLRGAPGCYREDGGIAGGGEHPLGRACDFMLMPAGHKVTGKREALGEDIVAWVREHADEYGIWYVIYEQHIWSSRLPQQGWKLMEDRGSITQNHFDHVHISVY